MFKTLLGVSAVGLTVILTGCAPSSEAVAQVRTEVVDTYRHYDSLCVGLPERVEEEASGKGLLKRDAYVRTPYRDCLVGGWNTQAAPSKAWQEIKQRCQNFDSDPLREVCLEEAESQYFERLGKYPTSQEVDFVVEDESGNV